MRPLMATNLRRARSLHMNRPSTGNTAPLSPTIKELLLDVLGETGQGTSSERPWTSEVDWLDGKIRRKLNLIFNTYLIDKSASDLVALAEWLEQEATGPEERERVNCSNCGRESSTQHTFCTYCGTELKPVEVRSRGGEASPWFFPYHPDDYDAPDWDPDCSPSF